MIENVERTSGKFDVEAFRNTESLRECKIDVVDGIKAEGVRPAVARVPFGAAMYAACGLSTRYATVSPPVFVSGVVPEPMPGVPLGLKMVRSGAVGIQVGIHGALGRHQGAGLIGINRSDLPISDEVLQEPVSVLEVGHVV